MMSIADTARETYLHPAVEPRIKWEIEFALAKNGAYPSDPIRACAVVVNEASEALAEALKLSRRAGSASHRGAVGTKNALLHELAQTAACCMMAIRELEATLDN